ncbi:DUF4176 domain-containing protein [Bacillus mycoides]
MYTPCFRLFCFISLWNSISIIIYGRKQKLMVKEPVMYDYIGCFYPEGYINPEYTFVFNHEDIEEIIFVGFIDEEEEAFVGFLN